MKNGQQSCSQLNGSLVDCGIVLYEALDERGNKLIQCKHSCRCLCENKWNKCLMTGVTHVVTPDGATSAQTTRLIRASQFTVKDESAINTPAVAAAFAIKAYDARNDNEISLEVSPVVT